MGDFHSDERGVSEVLGHLLSVAIVGMVMFGVVVSATTYFQQRDRVDTATELETQGQTLARTIGVVDRLVRQSDSRGEIGRTVDLPATLGDERYRITVVNRSKAASDGSGCSRPCLILETDDVAERVYFASVSTVASTTVVAGPLYVVRKRGGEQIQFRTQGGG